MGLVRKKAVAEHRRRREREGIVRLEVSVARADAPLVRRLASALTDPALSVETRDWLRVQLVPPPGGFKAMLAQAPLEGIDLDRPRARARKVDL
ncbi:MAG: hypothetical protein NBV67_19095 [Tagaea sp.]|nr:hypothetical protein [Tagaea sp.]